MQSVPVWSSPRTRASTLEAEAAARDRAFAAFPTPGRPRRIHRNFVRRFTHSCSALRARRTSRRLFEANERIDRCVSYRKDVVRHRKIVFTYMCPMVQKAPNR